jgi:hypothetical protein
MALNVVSSDRLSTNVKTSNLATDLSAVVGTRKNLLYNGSMEIAQRGTSFASIGSPGTYHLDRWRTTFTLATGRYTASQDSSGPAGFAKSLKVDVTTAEASLGASSAAGFMQMLEGQDLQQLQKGTATAKSVTFSFWVKSTTTGTYVVELQDSENNRILCKQYTISAANTWEKKTLTFAGDTTGALTADTSGRLYVQFFLAAGTNYTSGSLGANWAASVAANRMVGQTNLFSSTDNDWYVTGIQLEVGDTATEFEHTSYGDELLRCQRYFRTYGGHAAYQRIGIGYFSNTTRLECPLSLAPRMRTTPTMTVSDAGDWKAESPSGSGEFTAVGLDGNSSPQVAIVWGDKSSSFTAGESGRYLADNTTSARIYLSAEL